MALHDPVEDALNARKAAARRVEAGAAISDDALNVTNQFLGGGGTIGSRLATTFGPPERQQVGGGGSIIPPAQPPVRQFVGPSGRGLPSQASANARRRFGGQQGALRPAAGGTLADRFFNLPEPASFAQTLQGRQLLQRILGRNRGFR